MMPNFSTRTAAVEAIVRGLGVAGSGRFVQAVIGGQTRGARHGDVVAGVGGGLQVPARCRRRRRRGPEAPPRGSAPRKSHGGTAVSCLSTTRSSAAARSSSRSSPRRIAYLASRGSPIFGQPQLWAEFGLEITRVARRGDACVPQLKTQSVGDVALIEGAGIYVSNSDR